MFILGNTLLSAHDHDHSLSLSLSLSLPLQWEVATLALDVLYKLLSSHEFTEDDFQDSTYQLPNREVAIVPKSPGYSLLVHLMNNSQVLRKVAYTPCHI